MTNRKDEHECFRKIMPSPTADKNQPKSDVSQKNMFVVSLFLTLGTKLKI